MKITKREMMLLFVLGTVAILFIGLNYLVMPLYNSNKTLQDNLGLLNDQLLTLQIGQQSAGTIDAQIEKEAGLTAEKSAPFAQSIRPEQVSYWLNQILKADNLRMDAIEFTDVVTAVPNYENDRSAPPESTEDLPIQNTADIINGKQAAATPPPASATDAAAQPSAAATDTAAADAAAAAAAAAQAAAGQTAAPPETYCTQVVLNATGTYADIKRFMGSLYAADRPLTVDSLTISDYDAGGKMAVIVIRFFSAPLPDSVGEESYSFPAPAGQGALMQENIAPEPSPTATEAP